MHRRGAKNVENNTTIKSSTRKKRIGLINADQTNNEIASESCFKTFPFSDP
jgi:hypothetical protein